MKPGTYITPAAIRRAPDVYRHGEKIVTTGTPAARRDPETNVWTGTVESIRFTMSDESKEHRDACARAGRSAYYNATIHRDRTGFWISFDSPRLPDSPAT